jgi:hypothetical protein
MFSKQSIPPQPFFDSSFSHPASLPIPGGGCNPQIAHPASIFFTENIAWKQLTGSTLFWEDNNKNCVSCKKSQLTPGIKLQCCKGCSHTYYCGADCQKAHWKQHKSFCKPLEYISKWGHLADIPLAIKMKAVSLLDPIPIVEVGAGNCALAAVLRQLGYPITTVEPHPGKVGTGGFLVPEYSYFEQIKPSLKGLQNLLLIGARFGEGDYAIKAIEGYNWNQILIVFDRIEDVVSKAMPTLLSQWLASHYPEYGIQFQFRSHIDQPLIRYTELIVFQRGYHGHPLYLNCCEMPSLAEAVKSFTMTPALAMPGQGCVHQ